MYTVSKKTGRFEEYDEPVVRKKMDFLKTLGYNPNIYQGCGTHPDYFILQTEKPLDDETIRVVLYEYRITPVKS